MDQADIVAACGDGSQIVRVNYTLPAGSWQAIRGVFRYGGAGGTCPGGAYDDVDDSVFATAAQPSAAITSPASGATVSGSVTISANASTGVTKVVFYAGSAVGRDRHVVAILTGVEHDDRGGRHLRADRAGVRCRREQWLLRECQRDRRQRAGVHPVGSDCERWIRAGGDRMDEDRCRVFQHRRVEHAGVGYGYIGKANGVTGALAQQITIPAGRTATLSFWLNISSDEPATAAAVDQLFVEVLNTSGVKLATLATYSNRDEAANGAYHLESGFSLTPFAGQTIRLQFRGH